MFYTVTLNPSIDNIYLEKEFKLGKHNRVDNPHRNVGGKGINVGRVLLEFGEDVLIGGLLGYLNSDMIKKLLVAEGFENISFIGIDGFTRNAITIMHDNGVHTEIVEKGIELSKDNVNEILSSIIYNVQTLPEKYAVKYINLSGSANGSEDIYTYLLRQIERILDVDVLLDISGKQLEHVLNNSEKVFFIKPNTHEIADLLNLENHDKETIIKELNNPLLDNVEHLLVSCGSNGALYRYNGEIYDIEIPKVKVVNTTGSGDSTVGGFTYGLDKGYDTEKLLKFAMACGISNAMNVGTGHVDVKQVYDLADEVKVTKLD